MTGFENTVAMLKSTLGEFDGNGKKIVYNEKALEADKEYLTLMTRGVYSRKINFNFHRLKRYYGLKGRSAKDVLPKFTELMDTYLKKEYAR